MPTSTSKLSPLQSLADLLTCRPLRLEQTLIAVLRTAFEELDGERAGIVLFEDRTHQLAIDRAGQRVELEPEVIALVERQRQQGEGLASCETPCGAAWCALEPLSITVRRPSQPERELRRIPGDEVARIHGMLYLEGDTPRPPLSDHEAAVLRSLAQHAVTAVSHSRLYHQAICDELTGLVARAELERRLVEEIEVARERQTPLGLVYVDIDRMKQINEKLGYAGGDRVIGRVARLLEENTREIDTCARHGGARFALVLPETDAEGVKTLGKKLLAAVRRCFARDEPKVGFCAGGAAFPEHGEDAPSLKESADRALFSAKQSGPGTVRFFNRRTGGHDRFDKLAGLYTGKYAQDYRNLALVLETLSNLASQRSPAGLARHALSRLLEAARATRGTIFLAAAEGSFDPVTAQDIQGKATPTHELALETIELLGGGRPVESGENGTPCWYLPLPGSERLLGILCCEFSRAGRPDAEALALVTLFCELIGQALENILLLAELEQQSAELARRAERIEKLNSQLGEKLASREEELERLRTHSEDGVSRETLKYGYDEIIGASPAVLSVLAMMDKVVESEVAVLILGDSGTGKELIARAIHHYGPRGDKPFVTENCAALTETLLESELFGYVKGAFTGAAGNKKGLFEVASGGTMFLDEVGDMSPGMQKKLLRALQEGEIRPVGGKTVRKVDVRIISATNRDLKTMMEHGTFREDLYYRLNVVTVHLPPLRERQPDIPLLLDHFIKRISAKFGVPAKTLTPETLEYLVAYDWPGNIREMENEVNRMLFMGDDPITPDVLSENITRKR